MRFVTDGDSRNVDHETNKLITKITKQKQFKIACNLFATNRKRARTKNEHSSFVFFWRTDVRSVNNSMGSIVIPHGIRLCVCSSTLFFSWCVDKNMYQENPNIVLICFYNRKNPELGF